MDFPHHEFQEEFHTTRSFLSGELGDHMQPQESVVFFHLFEVAKLSDFRLFPVANQKKETSTLTG